MSDVDERIYRIKAAIDGAKSVLVDRGYDPEATNCNTAILDLDELVDDVLREVGGYVKVYVSALVESLDFLDGHHMIEDLVHLVPNQRKQEHIDAVVAVRALINQAGVVT